MKASRDEIGRVIAEATGKKVEHQLTTDYAIAIETLVNNNADLAFMGAQGYIEAKNGNDAIQPLVVPTGKSGTLDDAIYYSWLAVNVDDQDNFKEDGEFSLDTLQEQSCHSFQIVQHQDLLFHHQRLLVIMNKKNTLI